MTNEKLEQVFVLPLDESNPEKQEQKMEDHFNARNRNEADVRNTKIIEEWKDFLDTSSIPGLPKVGASQNILVKIFWLTILAGGTGVFLWQAQQLVDDYLQQPVAVAISVVTQRNIEFPSVTICNMNPLRRSKLTNGTRFDSLVLLDDQLEAQQKASPMPKRRRSVGKELQKDSWNKIGNIVKRQQVETTTFGIPTTVNWAANVVVGQGYPPIAKLIGNYSFVIFAILLLIFWIFTYFVVPETKNKTFDEIAQLFRNKRDEDGSPEMKEKRAIIANGSEATIRTVM